MTVVMVLNPMGPTIMPEFSWLFWSLSPVVGSVGSGVGPWWFWPWFLVPGIGSVGDSGPNIGSGGLVLVPVWVPVMIPVSGDGSTGCWVRCWFLGSCCGPDKGLV